MKEEWKKVKLGEISADIQTGPFGSQLHMSDYSEKGIPVVMPKDMINGKITEENIARVTDNHVKRLNRYIISSGNILYARRGDVGKCVYVSEKESGWLCGTGCLRININTAIANPKFVFFQLQKTETIGWVEKNAVGATMLNLNTSILANVPLHLPPLPTQQKIASVLSAYDDLIENNRRQIKLLEEAALKLYKEWFVKLNFPGHETTKIADGVPDGWKEGILSDIAIDVGKTVNKKDRNQYKYYLSIDCLPKKSLSYTSYNSVDLAESSLSSFNSGDVVFGAMRPYFHKVVIARDLGLTRNTCFVINSENPEYYAYMVMLLFSEDTIKYATKISVGTTMPYVRWTDFQKMPIIIPSKQISQNFGQLVIPYFEKSKKLALQIEQLQLARDKLLPKLMNGEIEV